MKRLVVVVIGVALSGCAGIKEHFAEKDNETCQSYGAQPGTDIYVACRMKQQELREEGMSSPGPRTCNRTGNTLMCY